jgi:dihydrolipoamide dehydrogenase
MASESVGWGKIVAISSAIQGYAIARQCEATEAELMATIFPHPTLSEAMHEAVLDAWGRVLHY